MTQQDQTTVVIYQLHQMYHSMVCTLNNCTCPRSFSFDPWQPDLYLFVCKNFTIVAFTYACEA
jgi:hypothetical protein